VITGRRGRAAFHKLRWLSSLPKVVRSPIAIGAMTVVALWLVLAAAAPLVAPYPPLLQNIPERLSPPGPTHWLGTDPLGRDILSRILFGGRISIPVGIGAVTLAAIIGTVVGSIAGWFKGVLDETIMRITDLMLAIMIAWWPSYARLVRGLVLSVREREYVLAAQAVGASDGRVYIRHVLPNIVSSIIILVTLDVGHAILTFASLSFLGLGPPPEVPEWGSMIALGRDYFDQWWIGTFPGLAILSLTLAFNIVGDSVRDLLDPRLRRQ